MSNSSTLSKNLKRKPPPSIEVNTRVEDLSFNDSFQSFESPKPKGPRDLWEYNDTLQSPTGSRTNPPYPIEDPIELDMIFDEYESPSQIRTKEIINQSIYSTSPIIPTLSTKHSFPSIYTQSPLSSPNRHTSIQSSRSPSPPKRHYRDHSIGSIEFNIEDTSNTSRWNSVQSRKSYHVVSDNPFYEVDDEKGLESPATEYFDYSILPELPKSSTATLTKELPPTPLDLPSLPFDSSSLQMHHFETCMRVWSLSDVFQWCLKLRIWLNESSISKQELKKAIVRLLAYHRNDISLDILTKNCNVIIESLIKSGSIQISNNLVMFHHGYINGVLPELTPCYSQTPHFESLSCYSNICPFSKQLNLERIMRNTNIDQVYLQNDWASHWHLTVEDLRNLSPGLIKQQSYIFDLLRYEQTFIERSKCFVEIVAPEFIKAAKELSVPIKQFEEEILTVGERIVNIHKSQLFEPLLRILISEGKFIQNINEIANVYRNWVIEVGPYLIKYMNHMPLIEELLKLQEMKSFVDTHISNLPRVKQLKVNVAILFISTFNSRYQQIPLQLLDIRKKYQDDEPEFISLTTTIEEIKKLGNKINESKKIADSLHALQVIKSQLSWKSSIRQTNLNLTSANRKFICRGDLIRRSDLKFTTSLNHVILLDNYLIISEKSKSKTGTFYKIIEDPIPIDFIIFEEKFSKPKSLPPSPSQIDEADEDQAFEFKVRYAGRSKHSYTFSTRTERERNEWLNYIKLAKTNFNKKVQVANPYKLQLISNTCFGYEYSQRVLKLQILDPYDPIYQLCLNGLEKLSNLGIVDDLYSSRNRVVFSKVQCMNTFSYNGSKYTIVGLNQGLYMCESKSRWKKIVNGSDFTKVHTDTVLNLVIVLNDRQLKYYPIHQFVNVYNETDATLSSVLLSKEPVSFFTMGKHKNITMLFYAKRKANATTHFRVLIPESDNGVFQRFKDDKKFYIEAECFGISIFNSSFTVFTNKGFEVLELDKLIPRTVPDLPSEDKKDRKTQIETIRKLISSSNIKPLGMFKLQNNNEFLLVYNEFAIFINKHGKLSRSSILIFEFKVKSVKFLKNHLFIINEEVIEILSISDFVKGTNKLIQVITGKDIRLINDENVSIAMANPMVCGLQLVFNLVCK